MMKFHYPTCLKFDYPKFKDCVLQIYNLWVYQGSYIKTLSLRERFNLVTAFKLNLKLKWRDTMIIYHGYRYVIFCDSIRTGNIYRLLIRWLDYWLDNCKFMQKYLMLLLPMYPDPFSMYSNSDPWESLVRSYRFKLLRKDHLQTQRRGVHLAKVVYLTEQREEFISKFIPNWVCVLTKDIKNIKSDTQTNPIQE